MRNCLNALKTQFPEMPVQQINQAYEILLHCVRENGKILTCGNGGSAADAEHIVGELMKGFRYPRELSNNQKNSFDTYGQKGKIVACKLQNGIQAISLNSQISLLTAVGNDTGYDMIFAQQVYIYGDKNDILIAMSTSGNSENIVCAAITAKAKNMKVIGITGMSKGHLGDYCDVCISIPRIETYQIQELTLPLYHAWCADLEEELFAMPTKDSYHGI